MYYLTPVGREHARNTIYKTFLEDGQDGYHNEIKININYPKSDELIKSLIKKNESLDKRFEKSSEIFQFYSKKFTIRNISLNSIEDENNITFEKIESSVLESDVISDDSLIAEYCHCIENLARKFNYAEKIDAENNDKLISLLLIDWGDWIMKPITSKSLCSMMHRSPVAFWNAAKQENYLPKFAYFALKLLPLVGSEASVERKLWRQRTISPPDRSSNSEITELDRVLLSDSMDD